MRVVYITAGAGGMYCGACARDAALVRGLMRRGCEVRLIPLYTPMKLDAKPPACTTRVFFGGINVYLQQHFPLFRRTPRLLDGLLDNEVLLTVASEFGIDTDPVKLGKMTLSMLKGNEGFQRKELTKLLSFLEDGPRPDLVNVTNTLLSGLLPPLKDRLNAPIVCTLQGEDQFVESMPEPYRTESHDLIRRNVQAADAFVAPSDTYAATMAEFLGVPRARITVSPTGVDVADYPAAPSRSTQPFVVGYLSRMTRGKGFDVLLEAFRILVEDEHRDVCLKAAGQILDDEYWKAQRPALSRTSLAARFQHHQPRDLKEKVAFLHGCSAFSVPSRHPEVRATAVLEAMATGLPVVLPDIGIFPELIRLTGGGVLFPPGDAARLAAELANLIDHPQDAQAMGLAAREGVRRHYSLERMAEDMLNLYARLREGGS